MVLQPSIDYSFGSNGLALNVWSSFSFVNQDLNEIDLTLSYAFKKTGNLWLEAGFAFYGWYFVDDFSLQNNTSQELFISAGFPEILTHPNLTVFYDYANGNGFYFLLETDHSIRINSSIRADLSASLGYNGGQWLADEADPGLSDLNIRAAVLWKLKDWIVSPFANYTFVLLDALGKANFIYFGIGISYKKTPVIASNLHR